MVWVETIKCSNWTEHIRRRVIGVWVSAVGAVDPGVPVASGDKKVKARKGMSWKIHLGDKGRVQRPRCSETWSAFNVQIGRTSSARPWLLLLLGHRLDNGRRTGH